MRKDQTQGVRIIGGQWRGRRLRVPDLPGLRPSGDRCRETLFNWLQAQVPGAVCADLFAGTGSLGLEAASRGAHKVYLIDNNPVAVSHIDAAIDLLQASGAVAIEADALAWLSNFPHQVLDLVFVDPPFDEGLCPVIMDLLARTDCLRPGGFAYFETGAEQDPVLPAEDWVAWREKVISGVRLQLLRCPET